MQYIDITDANGRKFRLLPSSILAVSSEGPSAWGEYTQIILSEGTWISVAGSLESIWDQIRQEF